MQNNKLSQEARILKLEQTVDRLVKLTVKQAAVLKEQSLRLNRLDGYSVFASQQMQVKPGESPIHRAGRQVLDAANRRQRMLNPGKHRP